MLSLALLHQFLYRRAMLNIWRTLLMLAMNQVSSVGSYCCWTSVLFKGQFIKIREGLTCLQGPLAMQIIPASCADLPAETLPATPHREDEWNFICETEKLHLKVSPAAHLSKNNVPVDQGDPHSSLWTVFFCRKEFAFTAGVFIQHLFGFGTARLPDHYF